MSILTSQWQETIAEILFLAVPILDFGGFMEAAAASLALSDVADFTLTICAVHHRLLNSLVYIIDYVSHF
jgi:hypothetical protein